MRSTALDGLVLLKLVLIVVLTLMIGHWIATGWDHSGFQSADHGHFRLIRRL